MGPEEEGRPSKFDATPEDFVFGEGERQPTQESLREASEEGPFFPAR